MSKVFNLKKPAKYGNPPMYGMDYIGSAKADPMDAIIAQSLRATGEEYARRTGKNMNTGLINVEPSDKAIDKDVVAISMDLEGDEDLSVHPKSANTVLKPLASWIITQATTWTAP
jgi:hypothetical protein